MGIEIKFSGFADKLATFALSIVKALFDPAQMTKNERLRMQREALERQLTNTALKAGSQVTLMRRRVRSPVVIVRNCVVRLMGAVFSGIPLFGCHLPGDQADQVYATGAAGSTPATE